jgi:hypothetical protein
MSRLTLVSVGIRLKPSASALFFPGLTTAKLDATGHRWLADLATYDFNIKYRPGKNNADADGLSRIPTDTRQVLLL